MRRDYGDFLNSILWILRTGAPSQDLSTAKHLLQAFFQEWVKARTPERILRAMPRDLEQYGGLGLRETFIDGSFTAAKNGVLTLGQPNAERVPRS